MPSAAAIAARCVLVVGALALALVAPGTASAEEPAPALKLSWETGEGKSYLIPALEIGGFLFGLNQFDRHVIDRKEYGSDWGTIRKNLTSREVIDRDPFSVNQIGHPYQGTVYYGFARSAGLNYWQSLLYALGGSLLWETAGESTPPSLNDNVASGIGGTFLGEPLFRMASLLLEGGGEKPGFWRELGAAVLSPPTGFNRLVFGERFAAIFPSRDPATFVRLRLGATVITGARNAAVAGHINEHEGSVDFGMTYGLPGKPGYRYTRPFDYFDFHFTGVPNRSTAGDAIENVSARGLLVGARYELSESYRGVWGLFGSYDYHSPQIFRVSTTAVSLGTAAQWWLSRVVALQGTALGGLGFGAAGSVADKAERDYHYGLIPQTALGLRLILGDRAMLETTGRQYFVAGTGSGGGLRTNHIGAELIDRGAVGFTVRVHGPHAIAVEYVVSRRDAPLPGVRDRHQSIETVTVSYSFLGHSRFGAVEWRPGETGDR